MHRSIVLVSAFLVALAGCSSSTTPGSTSATTSATTGTGTGTGTATGAGGAGGAGAGGAGAGGGAATAACTNDADKAIQSADPTAFHKSISDCATTFIGQDKPTKDCIKEKTGLSDACTACFGDEVLCAASKCLTDCMADQNGQACTDCRATNCDGAFEACSGVKP